MFDIDPIRSLIEIPGNRLSYWRTYRKKLDKVHNDMYEEGVLLGSSFTIANTLQ